MGNSKDDVGRLGGNLFALNKLKPAIGRVVNGILTDIVAVFGLKSDVSADPYEYETKNVFFSR